MIIRSSTILYLSSWNNVGFGNKLIILYKKLVYSHRQNSCCHDFASSPVSALYLIARFVLFRLSNSWESNSWYIRCWRHQIWQPSVEVEESWIRFFLLKLILWFDLIDWLSPNWLSEKKKINHIKYLLCILHDWIIMAN